MRRTERATKKLGKLSKMLGDDAVQGSSELADQILERCARAHGDAQPVALAERLSTSPMVGQQNRAVPSASHSLVACARCCHAPPGTSRECGGSCGQRARHQQTPKVCDTQNPANPSVFWVRRKSVVDDINALTTSDGSWLTATLPLDTIARKSGAPSLSPAARVAAADAITVQLVVDPNVAAEPLERDSEVGYAIRGVFHSARSPVAIGNGSQCRLLVCQRQFVVCKEHKVSV